MGENGFEKMQKDCLNNINEMKEKAERLYINWMQATAKAQVPAALVRDNLAISKCSFINEAAFSGSLNFIADKICLC